MFTAIKIQDPNYKFKTGDNEGEINGLNKINIFVGQNNSGKSRFMRSIFANDLLFKDKIFIDVKETCNSIYKEIFSFVETNISSAFFSKEKKDLKVDTPNFNYFDEQQNYYTRYNKIKTWINELKSNTSSGVSNLSYSEIGEKFNDIINTSKLEDHKNILNFTTIKKVYIPLLRGLKNPIKDNKENDIYYDRIKGDYFPQNNIDFEVFTGLSLYEDIRKRLLGDHEERKNIRDFEKFLSDNFFGGENIVIIPKHDQDVLNVKIGEKEQRAIFDLGDGIQTIIINTFPIFKYKDENLLLFIEEPEFGLHPGMQRTLLETFAKGIDGQEGEHQIYFTTHSNHFLDIALDQEINEKISIYQFEETENEKEKYIKNISQNKEILNLLGVRNSSVFLSNCTIWVEGISDRIYIRKFLELYQETQNKNRFEEDKHFSILEYGGSNITHFNFGEGENDAIIISAIDNNNFLIADNDGKDHKGRIKLNDHEKSKRLKNFSRLLKDKFFCEHREVENLLGETILKKYIENINFEGKDIELNLRNLNNIDWGKNIGIILKNHFISKRDGKDPDYFKQTHIGCIGKTKLDIAKEITSKHMNDYKDLSKTAKKLVKQLYDFIDKSNKIL